MSSVAADAINGHEDPDDDTQGSEDEEGDGEGDLLDRGPVVQGVGGVHHDVFVRNREGVIYVRH